MEYKWEKTSAEVYRAIYGQHKEKFSVFESYTDMGTYGEKLRAQITAWGFKDAEHPLIRSELRDYDDWSYYILKTAYIDD